MSGKERYRGMIDRRTFLKCSGMLGVGLACTSLMPVSESVAFNRKLYKVTRTRLTMGSFAAITVMHPSQDQADEAIGKAFEEMERLSRLVNRYKSDSAVGTLNRDGYIDDLPPELSEVIARALHLHKASGGAFDITVAPLVDLYKDHFASHGTPPSEAQVAKIVDLVGADSIALDGRSVRFAKPGMGITLDGIAVGYIVDRCAKVLERQGIKHALINASGDICAVGGKEDGVAWTIAVQNPDKSGPYLDKISLTNGAISTSGNYEIYFDREKLYHHIVSPKTGRSPLQSRSVTVKASSVMDADALSTTVFVLEPEAGKRFIEQMPGTECLILTSAEDMVKSSGWPTV